MMKFFAAFLVTSTLLVGASSFAVPTKIEVQSIVPSKIVDSKKIGPIKVPYTACIVSHVEVTHDSLEERMAMCLTKRNWLNINIDQGPPRI